jgi:hypothetical protein
VLLKRHDPLVLTSLISIVLLVSSHMVSGKPAVADFAADQATTPAESTYSIPRTQAFETSFLDTNLPTTADITAQVLDVQLSAVPYGRDNSAIRLRDFVAEVSNGDQEIVRGVFIANEFALPVIQQPDDNPIYVSTKQGQITQFGLAKRGGITGLLAHNYLSGAQFYDLDIGDELFVVYGDGSVKTYRVSSFHNFEKLNPDSSKSNYRDLDTGRILTTRQVFNRFYRGVHRVTLQTCLENEGNLNWGLTFISATPLQ